MIRRTSNESELVSLRAKQEWMTIKNRPDTRKLYKKLPPLAKLTILFFGLYLMLFQPTTADAHSALLEMEPAERVVIEDPPSMLSLRFNEPIDHELAIVTVYDWNAKPVFTGNPDGDIERSPLLEFALPELKSGTYTVNWNIVSSDGHPVNGTYAFSVGEATTGKVKSVEGGESSELGLILARVITEGLLLVGAGLIWFGWLAERSTFPGVDILWKKGRSIGMIVLFLGTIAELIAYALTLPPGIIQVISNGRWDLLLEFPFILMICGQLFFLLMLVIPGMMRGWYLTLWLALVVTPAFGGMYGEWKIRLLPRFLV